MCFELPYLIACICCNLLMFSFSGLSLSDKLCVSFLHLFWSCLVFIKCCENQNSFHYSSDCVATSISTLSSFTPLSLPSSILSCLIQTTMICTSPYSNCLSIQFLFAQQPGCVLPSLLWKTFYQQNVMQHKQGIVHNKILG